MKTSSSLLKPILITGLVAGTLDIICAILFLAKGNIEGTLRFIARGAFGDLAFSGGSEMILLGLLFHYIIAFSFTTAYFITYPLIPFLRKQKIISGLLYGVIVWGVMHFMVLPLSHNAPGTTNIESVWKPLLILMVAVGLPISLSASRYYSNYLRM